MQKYNIIQRSIIKRIWKQYEKTCLFSQEYTFDYLIKNTKKLNNNKMWYYNLISQNLKYSILCKNIPRRGAVINYYYYYTYYRCWWYLHSPLREKSIHPAVIGSLIILLFLLMYTGAERWIFHCTSVRTWKWLCIYLFPSLLKCELKYRRTLIKIFIRKSCVCNPERERKRKRRGEGGREESPILHLYLKLTICGIWLPWDRR